VVVAGPPVRVLVPVTLSVPEIAASLCKTSSIDSSTPGLSAGWYWVSQHLKRSSSRDGQDSRQGGVFGIELVVLLGGPRSLTRVVAGSTKRWSLPRQSARPVTLSVPEIAASLV
jgi:hypothetical protein